MNRAKVPADIQPFLFAATLHAAKKKNNGIRPIAVGDVFARLTSKCLAAILAEDAVSVFGPHQLGIKIRGGCESVIHAASTSGVGQGTSGTSMEVPVVGTLQLSGH